MLRAAAARQIYAYHTMPRQGRHEGREVVARAAQPVHTNDYRAIALVFNDHAVELVQCHDQRKRF